MATHDIVCTEQTNCTQGGHILAVGADSSHGKAQKRYTVREVYALLDRGDVFYTAAHGKVALVRKYDCPCGRGSLRSAPDATTANNLDSLRLCSWQAA